MSVNLEKRRKPKVAAKYPVSMCRDNGKPKFFLDGETKEQFIKLYPKYTNFRIMKLFGISASTVDRFRRELSLHKDMKAIRKEQVKSYKNTCKKNGYFQSLKGKRPSEACIEATKRLRAAGFTPITRLKETNPRKYRAAMAKKSATRKELFRIEALREQYGLKRKTKIKIVQNKIKHNASAYKYYMIKKANYFADQESPFNICFDSQTQRSAKMEKTAAKHGLHILQGDE